MKKLVLALALASTIGTVSAATPHGVTEEIKELIGYRVSCSFTEGGITYTYSGWALFSLEKAQQNCLENLNNGRQLVIA